MVDADQLEAEAATRFEAARDATNTVLAARASSFRFR